MIAWSHPIDVWCPRCRHQVVLTNLEAWPSGALVIGECPECQGKVASRKPVEWVGEERGSHRAESLTE